MKILYVAKIDEDYSLDFGVGKKINGQIQAFKNLGLEVDYLRMKEKRISFNDKSFEIVKYRYFSYYNFYQMIKRKKIKYDFVYLRYAKGDIYFYKTVKLFAKNNTKVLIEIPTYPYTSERKDLNLKTVISGVLDKLITTRLKKYVFRIVTTNKYDTIFGIKTICINNGIDTSLLRVNPEKEPKDSVNLIGIANLARWHGYDRLISGLSNYYSGNIETKNVNFYIVGDGDERKRLVELVKKLNIEDKVHFLGSYTGEELDKIFVNMDIGISSLALYRAGGGHDPIKSKEFLGRGLPVVLGYKDKLIDMNKPYVYYVNEDDSPVDIENIISKYINCNCTTQVIREYAEKELSWTTQIKKIVIETT